MCETIEWLEKTILLHVVDVSYYALRITTVGFAVTVCILVAYLIAALKQLRFNKSQSAMQLRDFNKPSPHTPGFFQGLRRISASYCC